jgi:hypothetical protein
MDRGSQRVAAALSRMQERDGSDRASADARSSSQAGGRRRGFETLAPHRAAALRQVAAAAALLRVVHCEGNAPSPEPELA